ncbi:MAG: RsmD family RNA methyltransferase [Candidatus Omnitrophota bacterium]|nr:RsmD family RNA methyltransferase [Candidatus Omnitrophota bacterium]
MQISIEKIIYPGKSLGIDNNKTVLTDEGLAGETVEVTPISEKKNYIEAKTIRIITPSPRRTTPRCSHYQSCGPYQYIDYKEQIAIKEAQLKEMFPGIPFSSTPSKEIWGYRNKIKLNMVWENSKAAFAYNAPESRNELIRIDSCFLVSENVNSALSSFLETINKENLNLIKEVQIRESRSTKDLMLTAYPFDKSGKFSARAYIEENIMGNSFRIGPESFFQVNVPMLGSVLEKMRGLISPGRKEVVADLYCGIGTFGINLSGFAKKVIGVESGAENISFLKNNLKLNDVKNYALYEGACEKIFPQLMNSDIDVLILDPPRKGLDTMLCQRVVMSRIKKIFYLSCNPSTLSRDIKILNSSYRLKSIHLFDFFPHTPHIETLAILEKA